MKTLDIFHTWFIIYAIVTKTMITFLNTFNFCFTENPYTILKGGVSHTLPDILKCIQTENSYFTLK